MAKKEKQLIDHDVWIKQFGNGWTFEGHKTYEPYERETTKTFCPTKENLVRELANYLDLGRLCLLPLGDGETEKVS